VAPASPAAAAPPCTPPAGCAPAAAAAAAAKVWLQHVPCHICCPNKHMLRATTDCVHEYAAARAHTAAIGCSTNSSDCNLLNTALLIVSCLSQHFLSESEVVIYAPGAHLAGVLQQSDQRGHQQPWQQQQTKQKSAAAAAGSSSTGTGDVTLLRSYAVPRHAHSGRQSSLHSTTGSCSAHAAPQHTNVHFNCCSCDGFVHVMFIAST
jgi:hypothetical protein